MENSVQDLCLPASWWSYGLSILVAAILIRLTNALLRTMERCGRQPRPAGWKTFGLYLLGFKFDALTEEEEEFGGGNDFLQPVILGLLELLIYPILMGNNLPVYIGAWLGFKVVPRLGSWEKSRNTYQRFLIGNALVILASYLLMRAFIA